MDWVVPVVIAAFAAAIAILTSWHDLRRTRRMTPAEKAEDRIDQQTW